MFRPNITLSVSYNKGICHLYIKMQTLQKYFPIYYVFAFLFDQQNTDFRWEEKNREKFR